MYVQIFILCRFIFRYVPLLLLSPLCTVRLDSQPHDTLIHRDHTVRGIGEPDTHCKLHTHIHKHTHTHTTHTCNRMDREREAHQRRSRFHCCRQMLIIIIVIIILVHRYPGFVALFRCSLGFGINWFYGGCTELRGEVQFASCLMQVRWA